MPQVIFLVTGIAAWWVLVFLTVQRALNERPKHAFLGTPVAVTGFVCLVVLLWLDLSFTFTGASFWFMVISIGHFMLVMTPLAFWVLWRRKRMGWDVDKSASA